MLLGCHTQQKTEGNPDSNLSDDLLPSPPSCPHPCCTGRRGYSCLQKGSRISCCMVGNSRLCRLATGLRQDKFTSLETQQLGPRGVAAELGEISGLSSFSDFFFSPLPRQAVNVQSPRLHFAWHCGEPGLPSHHAAILVKPIRAHSMDHTVNLTIWFRAVIL